MAEPFIIGGGNSSISLDRNAKGEYIWGCKLYFVGHDMRTLKQITANILKTRRLLEVGLGQEVIDSEEQSAYMKALLQAELDATVRKKPEPEKGKK